MAGYSSLRIRGDGVLAARLGPLFDTESFSPAAAGGLAPGPAGTRWFLAGLCVEDFVGRFLERGARAPADVRLHEAAEAEERGYLESMRDRLGRLDSTVSELSPFERPDDSLGATSLAGPSLDVSVLDEIDAWRADAEGAVVYLYGSIALSAAESEVSRAFFRYLFPSDLGLRSIGAPLVLVRAEGVEDASTTVIDLYTSATVWLCRGGGLNGRVGPDDADENLDTLADVAGRLIAAGDTQSAELRLNGPAFVRERERFEERLAPMVDSIEAAG